MAYKALHSFRSVLLVAVLLAIAGCGSGQLTPTATTAPTAAAKAAKAIVIADISDNPTKRIAAYQPLADYLAANLSAFGITVGQVKIAPDFETMIKWMKSGEIDMYFDSPYPAMILRDQAGARPILRRWKAGVSEYHTVFFTKSGSGIASMADLKGHMLSFKTSYSTSGYLLPKAYLIQAGLKPAEKATPGATLAKDEVGYVFTGDSTDNDIQWVISGKVAAGAVDNVAYAGIPDDARKGLTILAETENVARQLAMVRAGLDPKLVDAIKALLLELDKTDDGQAILKTFQATAKFDELPGGIDAMFARIEELSKVVTK